MAAVISGKTVVITGGNRGIGRGLVEKFLGRGNTVIATSRDPASAGPLSQLAAEHSRRLHVMQLDVTELSSIKRWAEQVASMTRHVDILINNAGIYGKRLPLAELDATDFALPFTTNAVGPFLVTQQLLKQGLLGPPGSLVINVTSIMASHGDPTVSRVTGGGYAYRASKAALNIISHALQLDLGECGVSVCLVHPGYVSTDMTNMSGWISVEESTTGIMALLEDGRPLAGKFWAFSGEEIPW